MLALRIIVEWDGAVVEDRLYRGREVVLVGSGPAAHSVAPGPDGRYIAFVRRGAAWELRVPAGLVRAIDLPGESLSDGRAGYLRTLSLAGVETARCGSLVLDDAIVTFELIPLGGARGDAALWGWAGAALLLALVGGGSYQLSRALGDGSRPQWGRPEPLAARDASHLRIKLGADGKGASRPQAGRGQLLSGPSRGNPSQRRLIASAPPKKLPRLGRARVPKPTLLTARPRAEVIDQAQAALLNADLRQAIDGFSRAEKEAPLDYDQLNWLGLAHYMQGSYDDAERAWLKARAMDPLRPDAINNLANVAKRRGDTTRELGLIEEALSLRPDDCHATNGLALALARSHEDARALQTLTRSDEACGGNYAYTSIQRAALLALAGDRDGAFRALETGLQRVDTLVPIKEFEVWNDLVLDPAFALLRDDARFALLTAKYLPRAAGKS